MATRWAAATHAAAAAAAGLYVSASSLVAVWEETRREVRELFSSLQCAQCVLLLLSQAPSTPLSSAPTLLDS